MRDDRNYYELTRGPVDGPAPGDAVDAIDGALPCPRSLQSRRTRSTRKHSALVVERTGCHVIGGRAPSAPGLVEIAVAERVMASAVVAVRRTVDPA